MSLETSGEFCKHLCAIILLQTDISKSILFEFYGTYFGINKGELETMFEASVRDDFFEDKDEKSYSVLELCNISDALEDDKEELEHRLRILQGLT